jgi:hypothetical protein
MVTNHPWSNLHVLTERKTEMNRTDFKNIIQVPPNLNIRIVLTLDPNTQQCELKIERGKITNLQLATLLLEHATHIARQLMQTEAILISKSSPIITPEGGTPNGAA